MNLQSADHLFWFPILPLIAAVIISLIPEKYNRVCGYIGCGVCILIALLSTLLEPITFPWNLQPEIESLSYSKLWLSDYDLSLRLTLDGLSGWLILLTSLAAFSAMSFSMVTTKVKNHTFGILILFASAIGVFLSRDLITLLFSWGLWLIIPFTVPPRIETQKRTPGYMKFFVFQLLSLFLIMTALSIVFFSEFKLAVSHNLDISTLTSLSLSDSIQKWVLLLFFAGIAIRMPLFPFHSWLSDSLNEMPAPVSAMLTATGTATGTYAILQFLIALCPDATIQFNKYFIFIAMVSMIHGAMVALVNPHILQRLTFCSLGYSGLILMGIFSLNDTSLSGAALVAMNFTIVIPILILASGWISHHTHSVLLQDMGGIWKKSPLLAGVFLLGATAFVGVPGLCLFPGLFLTISGILLSQPTWAAIAIVSFIILAAGILWMFQQIFTGTSTQSTHEIKTDSDISAGRTLILISALAIWFGFFPQYMIRSIKAPVGKIQQQIQAHRVFKTKQPQISPMELMLQKNRTEK